MKIIKYKKIRNKYRVYFDNDKTVDLFEKVIFVLLLVLTLLDLFFPEWQLKLGEWMNKKMGIKKRPTEWEEYLNQIEEMSELDEEKEKTEN